MAQNLLPPNPGALAVLAGKCAAGLTTYGTALNITQITAAGLSADAAALQAAMGSFNASRAARTAATAILHTASDAAKTFLANARSVLVAHWGQDYSQNWASAGWTNNSTAVPTDQPARLALVNALAGFLTANPAYAASAPPIVFTAAQASAVAQGLQAGLDGVGAADTAAATAKDARTTADTALRKELRALIGILTQLLTPNDARWTAFGLNAPGKATTPAAPKNLAAQPALPAQIHVTCDMSAGADHLRWFVQKAGQPNFEFVGDSADGELLYGGLPGGQTVQVHATAFNTAGESVPSATLAVPVA